MSFTIFTIFVALLSVATSHGCDTSTSPPSLDERVMEASLVVLARLDDRLTQREFGVSYMYFDMEVLCILKNSGTNIEQKVNVTHTATGGRCFSTNMKVGKVYYVFLRHLSGPLYRLSSAELPGSDKAALQNVCGLLTHNKYPLGVNSSAVTCPDLVYKPCPITTTRRPTVITKPRKTRPIVTTRSTTIFLDSSTSTSAWMSRSSSGRLHPYTGIFAPTVSSAVVLGVIISCYVTNCY